MFFSFRYSTPNLNFKSHIDGRIKKANNTFYSVRRNVFGLNYDAKLAVFKSLLLPKIFFAAPSITLSRASMKKLESFQKRVVKWMSADYHSCYCSLMLNVLPLPMFWQLNNLLYLSKIWHQNTGEMKLYETVKNNRRHTSSKLPTLWTERACSEFCFRTCGVVNLLPHYVDFFNPDGLKNRLLDYKYKKVSQC